MVDIGHMYRNLAMDKDNRQYIDVGIGLLDLVYGCLAS
jgi:hypothetical protein